MEVRNGKLRWPRCSDSAARCARAAGRETRRKVACPLFDSQAGVFTAIMMNDAVHVAAAVLTRQDILLSWNFKHLVNRVRRAKINQVNVSQGLPSIEIIAPPEI